MKTIHIKNTTEDRLVIMRKLYKQLLKGDETFHFVVWGGVKWQGHDFTGEDLLLRVDDKKVAPIIKFLKAYQEYEVYDYPFPNRRGHLNRFGLGKKSVEAKYPEIFHKIYNLYSVMSITMTDKKERREALMQLLHIPLNVYQMTFIGEAELYSWMAYKKIELMNEIALKK